MNKENRLIFRGGPDRPFKRRKPMQVPDFRDMEDIGEEGKKPDAMDEAFAQKQAELEARRTAAKKEEKEERKGDLAALKELDRTITESEAEGLSDRALDFWKDAEEGEYSISSDAEGKILATGKDFHDKVVRDYDEDVAKKISVLDNKTGKKREAVWNEGAKEYRIGRKKLYLKHGHDYALKAGVGMSDQELARRGGRKVVEVASRGEAVKALLEKSDIEPLKEFVKGEGGKAEINQITIKLEDDTLTADYFNTGNVRKVDNPEEVARLVREIKLRRGEEGLEVA